MLQAHKLIAPLAVGINCSGSMTTVRSVALYSSAAENVKDRLDAANKKVGKVLADGLGAAANAGNTLKEVVVDKDDPGKDKPPVSKENASKETAQTIRRQTESPNC